MPVDSEWRGRGLLGLVRLFFMPFCSVKHHKKECLKTVPIMLFYAGQVAGISCCGVVGVPQVRAFF